MAECGSCHAEIEWVVTESGARMPLDVASVEGGNLTFTGRTVNGGREVRYMKRQGREGGLLAEPAPTYVSHFATCPDAAQYRR